MWEYVDGMWNGASAAAMYQGPLLKTLERAYPEKAARSNYKWIILEDNDPTGYKSSKGKAGKAVANMVSMDLPRRSPDLNVLDYCLWHEINVRMRQKEAQMPKNTKESKEQYLKRLKGTALSLPHAFVSRAVKDMRRRVLCLQKAKGGIFLE